MRRKPMTHTNRIEKAIKVAASLHKDQTRKGPEKFPYITHLVSVFAILAQYTDDEDVLIAGLLHDTLEDTDYRPEELERDFGPRVREIVEGVTEPKMKDGEELPWIERKKEYIRGLQRAPKESLLVSAADKIHNFSSVLDEYGERKEIFGNDFKQEHRAEYYGRVVEIIINSLGENHPLAQRLRETFERYHIFLQTAYN